MEMRDRFLTSGLAWLVGCGIAWAAPSNTMSVTPACTSGATVTCSDETTRNNNISTPYNSHSHTDIAAMSSVNTFTIGDNTLGNKDYCEDGTTDRCLRYDSAANLWTIQQGSTSYNQIVTFSGTAGIGSGLVLVANGTGAIVALTATAPSDDATLVGDSASAATWRTLPNCTDASGNHLNYTQATNSWSCGTSASSNYTSRDGTFTRDISLTTTLTITTTGVNPSRCDFSMVNNSPATQLAVGRSTSVPSAGQGVSNDANLTADTFDAISGVWRFVATAGNHTLATLSSYGTAQYTLAFTKTGTPTGTAYVTWRCESS